MEITDYEPETETSGAETAAQTPTETAAGAGAMKRLALLVLFLAAPLWAAPPQLNIPPEIPATGEYATFAPQTDAVSVVYVGQSGVSAFPSQFLADRRAFVLPVRGLPAGKYQFTAVGASASGEQSSQAFAVVVGTVPDVTPPPPPPPPPPPVVGKLWVIVVEESATRTPATARILSDMQLRSELTTLGHKWRSFDPNDPGAISRRYDVLAAEAGGVPALLLLDQSGKVVHKGRLPADSATLLATVKQVSGQK